MTREEIQRIFDSCSCDYTVVAQIGSGTFGTVWLVKKRSLDNQLKAVKFLRRPAGGFPARCDLRRDVEGVKLYAGRNITHQNLIKILDTRDTGEDFFYCMDAADNANGNDGGGYVPDTLALRLKSSPGQQMGADELFRLGSALLDGLGALHRAGLCHRDVKPANVLFVNSIPVLTDMGCVAATGAAKYVGFTRAYIPPLAPGEKYSPIDHDLYALGKLLYSCWSGCDALDFPQVPLALLRTPEGKRLNRFFAMQACAGVQSERFRDAGVFASAFYEAVYGTEAVSIPKSHVRRSLASMRKRLFAWRFGTAALWLAVLCGWLFWRTPSSATLEVLDATAKISACGNSSVTGEGRGAQWAPGAGGVGVGLFSYPEFGLGEGESEISFSLASAAGKFNLDICFYPGELGAVMNPYNVFRKENFGGACRWLTLRFRNRRLEMTNIFFDGNESGIAIPKACARLSSDSERASRIRIVRCKMAGGAMRRTTVYVDGIEVAAYDEPETVDPRFAFALVAVAPERIKVSDVSIRRR